MNTKTRKHTFSSREDAEKWIADMFGNPPADECQKPSFEECWKAISSEPRPLFKPGIAMTERGVYVDENSRMWHIDPEEGNVDLIVPDDD